MKKILLLPALFILFLIGCKKNDHHENEIKNVTLNVTLKSTDTYFLDLTQYGDADDLSIIETQATNFSISKIDKANTNTSFNDIYTYTTLIDIKNGFKNTDKVVLKVYEPTDRHHIEETYITINFTIQ